MSRFASHGERGGVLPRSNYEPLVRLSESLARVEKSEVEELFYNVENQQEIMDLSMLCVNRTNVGTISISSSSVKHLNIYFLVPPQFNIVQTGLLELIK